MFEQSEKGDRNSFPVSLEINFNSKYIAPFDHKEQFAVCTSINSLMIKKENRYRHVCVFIVRSDIRG